MKEKEEIIRNFPVILLKLREKTNLLKADEWNLQEKKQKGILNEKNKRYRVNKLGQ